MDNGRAALRLRDRVWSATAMGEMVTGELSWSTQSGEAGTVDDTAREWPRRWKKLVLAVVLGDLPSVPLILSLRGVEGAEGALSSWTSLGSPLTGECEPEKWDINESTFHREEKVSTTQGGTQVF